MSGTLLLFVLKTKLKWKRREDWLYKALTGCCCTSVDSKSLKVFRLLGKTAGPRLTGLFLRTGQCFLTGVFPHLEFLRWHMTLKRNEEFSH